MNLYSERPRIVARSNECEVTRSARANERGGLISRMVMARTKRIQTFALARGFHKLDENFLRVRPGSQEEIHARTVGAGARGGIERRQREPRAQNFRRAIHIADVDVNLLNTFAELLQVARNCAG